MVYTWCTHGARMVHGLPSVGKLPKNPVFEILKTHFTLRKFFRRRFFLRASENFRLGKFFASHFTLQENFKTRFFLSARRTPRQTSIPVP